MRTSQQALLTSLERAVRACRPLAFRYFTSSTLRVERKPDRSPVTAADRAIEERLRRDLARLCPGEAVIGEEGGSDGAGGALGTSYWTIDPIDGTRAFSRGLPSWGMMIGRVERGRATLGVCDFPAIDTTIGVAPGIKPYERCRGRVAWWPKARPVSSLSHAVIFHGGAHWWAATPYAAGFARLVRGCYLERAYGDCYGYLWMLRGHVDVILDYGVKLWDLVPLAPFAQATGRALADCSGRESFTGPETLMAHPRTIQLVVKMLRTTRRSQR